MPISKIKSSSITADAASTNLNIDANTLFLDATNNRVGVGTTTPSQKLHVNVDSGNVYEQISSGANNVYLGFESARTASVVQSNNALVFDVGSSYTERMRITAGGDVGIGASNPAYKLDVVGTGSIISATRADTNRADIIVNNTGGTVAFGINNAAGNWLSGGLGYYGYILGPSSASYGLQFGVGASNTAALTITPVGRVGIGTVSPVAQLDIENSSVQPFGTAAQLNAIFKGSVSIGQGGAIGFDYFGSHTNAPTSMGYAIESQAGSTKGSLVFGTRSVTTDTAPTERMRINSDGEVLIGATAQGRETNLAVVGSYQDPTGAWAQVGIYSNDAFAINKGGTLMFGGQDGLNVRSYFAAIKGAKATSTDSDYSGYMSFFTRPVGDVPYERMRITNVGNLGVGTTAPLSRISTMGTGSTVGLASHAALRIQPSQTGSTDQIVFGYAESGSYANAAIGFTATDYNGYQKGHIFFANRNSTSNVIPTERVRITAPGELLVGQTSAAQGNGASLQPNLATAAVGHSGSFATVWNIPLGTCGIFTANMGGNGQYGGARLFFVVYGAASGFANASIQEIGTVRGDQSGYNWSWNLASNGQFQMRNDTNTAGFVPTISMLTLG